MFGSEGLFGAESSSKLYALAKEILTDLRGNAFRNEKARRKRYADLFDVVRRLHVDYINIFIDLRESCKSIDADLLLEEKEKFFSNRAKHASERTLAKSDADIFLNLSENLAEQRFLISVIWYFYYGDCEENHLLVRTKVDLQIMRAVNMGADRAWNSVSTRLWDDIKHSKDKVEIAKATELAIAQVLERYNTVVQYYTELEAIWRFPQPSRAATTLDRGQ